MSKYFDYLKHFGSNLKRIRKAQKLSQAGLAELLGTGRTTVNNWEKGVAVPTLERFVALLNKLDVNADDLLLEKSEILTIAAESSVPYNAVGRDDDTDGRESETFIKQKLENLESRILKLENQKQ